MGLLCDYFRAVDDRAVVDLMDRTDGASPARDRHDVVGAQNIDPSLVLGQLVAMAREVSFDDLNARFTELAWPQRTVAADYQGPWIQALSDDSRDALAGIPAGDRPELARQWAENEDLAYYDDRTPEAMQALIADLTGLAGRARDTGERLYCWVCL